MNLYFRLLRIIFKILTAPRLEDPHQPSPLTFRAWLHDIDLNMHLNNARYLSWMDLGRIHMMGRSGVLTAAYKRGWLPVVGHIDIKFIKPVPTFAKVTLETVIESTDEKYFHIKQTFTSQNRTVAVAKVKGVLVSKKEGIIPPEKVLEAVRLNQ